MSIWAILLTHLISTSCTSQPTHQGKLTVNSFAVFLFLAIVDCVFVLWQHFLLPGHLLVPSVDGLGHGHAIALEGCCHGIDDSIDCAKSPSLTEFLSGRETPWDFPAQRVGLATYLLVFCSFSCSDAIIIPHSVRSEGNECNGYQIAYQSRPPNRGNVGLNMMCGWRGLRLRSTQCLVMLKASSVFLRLRRKNCQGGQSRLATQHEPAFSPMSGPSELVVFSYYLLTFVFFFLSPPPSFFFCSENSPFSSFLLR